MNKFKSAILLSFLCVGSQAGFPAHPLGFDSEPSSQASLASYNCSYCSSVQSHDYEQSVSEEQSVVAQIETLDFEFLGIKIHIGETPEGYRFGVGPLTKKILFSLLGDIVFLDRYEEFGNN